MAKKPKIKKKLSPVMRLLRRIVRLFLGKHEVINLNDTPLPAQCILLGTHNGMNGPFVYQSYLPRFCVPWGTHEMRGNYVERWNYLYHVFYRKKNNIAKVPAFFKATIIALFSKMMYRGVGLIGTYTDGRQIKAIKLSIEHIEAGVPVMLFPENSNEGYFEVLNECHSGFVILANRYNRMHNTDIPVYPSYYNKKHRRIVIGKPLFVRAMQERDGLTREEIAEITKGIINGLRDVYGKAEVEAIDPESSSG
jgi:hypothetical protein